ncbi:phage integrase family protein, partial [Burkholderia sp. MSMB1498]|uniref:phage integrase family protein n=1 Tax=Burkholderia sp. MSMB1498 TaxID=1637842 RepID=UPI002F3E61EB
STSSLRRTPFAGNSTSDPTYWTGGLPLEFGRDARKAAATCSWLVTSFVVAARKRQDFATVRLLAIRPAAPSLEDFAAQHDPDGFYTAKELRELFAAQQTGADAGSGATLRRQQRNARLRARQMAALDALSRLVVEDPKPDHHVLGWFDTAVALRLSDVGLTTIGKLVETINSVGYRWYRRVPRPCEVGARRITAWLAHYEDVAGLRLTAGAITHPSERTLSRPTLTAGPVTAIVPLERFLLPPELDGSRGAHRNLLKNNSRANNDREAIEFWLADYENPHTRARYRTEAERLLLWAIFVKRKPQSSLDTDDARDYINGFLVDPQPAAQWVMAGTAPRDALEWRPFRGPLSVKSRQGALSATKKFFAELVDAQYLDGPQRVRENPRVQRIHARFRRQRTACCREVPPANRARPDHGRLALRHACTRHNARHSRRGPNALRPRFCV